MQTRGRETKERKTKNERAKKTNRKGGVMYRLNEEQTTVIEEVRRVADESIAPHAAEVDA